MSASRNIFSSSSPASSSSNKGLAWLLTELSASAPGPSAVISTAPEPSPSSLNRGLSKLPVESLSGDLLTPSGDGLGGIGLEADGGGPSVAKAGAWKGTGDWCTEGGPVTPSVGRSKSVSSLSESGAPLGGVPNRPLMASAGMTVYPL